MDIQEASKKIGSYMDDHKDEIVDFLKKFVSIKSVTYEEGEAVEWFSGKLEEFGYDEVRIDPVGNCLGRVGSGDTVVLYDAHIDTVDPGTAEEWGFDPLDAQVRDGHVVGRGAGDDKACLTGFAYAGRALKELGLDKDFTFWLSASLSEEDVEGSCGRAMLEENTDIKPDYIVIGEASEMRVIRGHKGRALLKVDVPGKTAHASTAWKGDNSLIKSIPLMQNVDAYDDFEEDPLLGRGSINVTNIRCATPSFNTVPGKTTVFIDRRIARGERQEDLLNEIKPWADEIGGTAKIDIEKVTTYNGYVVEQEDFFPSWLIEEDHPAIQKGVETFKTIFEKEPVVGVWDFCSNATMLCGKTGIPGVGFGPGDGSLAHSTEDSVPIDELVGAAKFYALYPVVMMGYGKN